MPSWNANTYLKFEKQRSKPAYDLAAEIPLQSPQKILDIGCGPGNSTAVLHEKYPDAEIIGIDSSPEMIEAAKSKYTAMQFFVFDATEDLTSFGTDFDIVFSNACIQWVKNHQELIPAMMRCLKAGGILAVQTPMNYEEPIHKIIEATTRRIPWQEKIVNPRIFFNLTQNEYYDIFSACAADFTLWQTTYFHILDGHEAIMEWYRGTGLRPYLESLTEADAQLFQKEIFEEVVKQYLLQADGKVIFRFPRFFMIAEK